MDPRSDAAHKPATTSQGSGIVASDRSGVDGDSAPSSESNPSSQPLPGVKKRIRVTTRTKDFLATAGISYFGMGLSLLSAPILARELGADGRGVLAGAFAAVQLLSWLSFLGLPRALSVTHVRDQHLARSGIVLLAILGVASCVLTFLSADLFANGDPRIALGIKLASFVLLLTGFAHLGNDIALARGHIIAWNAVRSASLVLPSVLYLVAFSTGQLTLESAFLATLAGAVLGVLAGSLLAVSAIAQSRAARIPWKFSIQYWSASAFDGLAGRADQILLAALVPASSLGIYAVAVTCASASGVLTQAINHTSFKILMNARTEDSGVPAHRKKLGMVVSLISGAMVIAAVALLGEPLFGPTFTSLVPVTSALVVFQLLNDQWQLRTYIDSATSTGTSLTAASAAAFILMLVMIVSLHLTANLDAFSMACSVVLFGAGRLCVRGYLRGKKTGPRSPRA